MTARALLNQPVLITGASGFLGGALAERLARGEGAQVRAVVRASSNTDRLSALPNLTLVEARLTDADALADAMQGCAAVFHLAGAVSGPLHEQVHANVTGTRAIAEAAVRAGVPRLVFSSSISVYGYDLTGAVFEDTPFTPTQEPYALTKRAAEAVLRQASREHGLSVSMVRPAMVYGPYSTVWTNWAFRLASLPLVPFPGQGHGSAYPIYVDDVVALLLLCATHPAADGQVFNASNSIPVTWRAFLDAYAGLRGQRARVVPFPPGLVQAAAHGLVGAAGPYTMGSAFPAKIALLQRQVAYRVDRAHDALGWQPQVSLGAGVALCAPYLRERGLLSA